MDDFTGTLTLVFDWGNTVMTVFPEENGAMLHWNKVAAEPGIHEALIKLQPHYRLILATNAVDSDASQVSQALARVGLADFFPVILTYHDLQARKPEPVFFERIRAFLNVPSSSLVMIGDDYVADIVGAHQSGWQAIWYNRQCHPAPMLAPLHGAELRHLQDLPAVMPSLNLPDLAACQGWMIERGASTSVWIHSQLVAAASYALAEWLLSAGEKLDPILAHRGGLLHDVGKIHNLAKPSGVDHGEIGAAYLLKKDQPALAEIARRHLLLGLVDETKAPRTWEEKIVFFCDKLVENNAIVNLEDRLAALKIRYPHLRDSIPGVQPALFALQTDLCRRLHTDSAGLIQRMQQVMLTPAVELG